MRISYFNEFFCYFKPWTVVLKIDNLVLAYVFMYIKVCSSKLAVKKSLPLELILSKGSYLFSSFVIILRTNKSFFVSKILEKLDNKSKILHRGNVGVLKVKLCSSNLVLYGRFGKIIFIDLFLYLKLLLTFFRKVKRKVF